MVDIADRLRGRNIKDLSQRDLFEFSVGILNKPGPEREDLEIDILVRYIENMEFLNKIKAEKSTETLSSLCMHLEYEKFDKDQIVFEEGSLGTKFYIILSGKVEILIKSNNAFSSSLYMPVMELTTGKSFGELAIMDDTLKPRKATIKCSETCHFATLSRKSFQAFLGFMKREVEANIESFCSNSLFAKNKWSNRLLEQWVKSFNPIGNLQRNAIIYKEGDTSDNLYFVRTGQVVNTKKMQISRPFDLHKDIILDERNQIYQVEHAKMAKEVEIAVWSEGTLFGEEEAFQVFKHERQLEREREKFKKDFMDIFEEERSKMENFGYRYKPPKDLMIPDDPNEDEKVIEMLLDKKIASLTQSSNKRETTVMVVSHSADVWIIPRNLFFTQLENNWHCMKELESMIQAKKKRRLERYEEFTNYFSKNIEYLSVQKSSMMNKNIESVIKQKRFYKTEQNNKFIFKEDSNYNSLVRSFKAAREETQSRLPTSPPNKEKNFNNTYASDFPIGEMREKSSISYYPNEDFTLAITINQDPVIKEPTTPSPVAINPIRPRTSVAVNKFKSAVEAVNVYNSFFSQLPETKFNKFQARKSRMYIEDIRSKTPNPVPKKPKVMNEATSKSVLTTNPNEKAEKKGMIIVENPLRGLSYTASLPYEEKKVVQKAMQKGYRISSQDTQVSDVLDPEQFLKDRMGVKNMLKEKIENSSPPKQKNNNNNNSMSSYKDNDNRFFTRKELLESDENFVDIFRTTTKILKLPVHEPKILKQQKPRPFSSTTGRTNANESLSKSSISKQNDSKYIYEESNSRIHEIHSRGSSPPRSYDTKPKDKIIVNTSYELEPIKEDGRYATDDYYNSKRSASPYSNKFEISKRENMATYSENFSPGSMDKAVAWREAMVNSEKFEMIEKNQENELKKQKVQNRSSSVPQTRNQTPLQKYRQKYAQEHGKTVTRSDKSGGDYPQELENQLHLIRPQTAGPSKEFLAKLAQSQVHHKAPRFVTKHRALSLADSNIFNRKPVMDKSQFLGSRRASDTDSVEIFRKKPKNKKNLMVKGTRERISKSVPKAQNKY